MESLPTIWQLVPEEGKKTDDGYGKIPCHDIFVKVLKFVFFDFNYYLQQY